MKPIVIKGLTYTSKEIVGTSRYSREVIRAIDKLLSSEDSQIDIRICYPQNLTCCLSLKNVAVVPIESVKHFFLINLCRYIKKNNAISCGFGNDVQLTPGGIVCIHDMRCFDEKGYDTLGLRKTMFLLKLSVKLMGSTIVTVSEYQRRKISKICSIEEDKITVIPNGWEHITRIDSDESIFSKNPEIKKENYYYTIGSMAKHKNFQWIYEVAKRNRNEVFVVAGGINKRFWGIDDAEYDLPNLIFTGYVSDEENVALMKNCKSFLFPSKYEGFGIPPLEALALGKKIIISNATCLPEIYGNCAVYFDPDDYEVDLGELLQEEVAAPDELLRKYTWENSAKLWIDLFKKVNN